MSLHSDLIAQARHLCDKEPKKPKQASLRRAVSTAYYALFHRLIAAAAQRCIAGKYSSLRPLVARIPKHATMLKACQKLRKHALNPGKMGPFLAGAVCSADLLTVAEDFEELQQARHEADYNVAKRFTKAEASDLVDVAKAAIEAFDRASEETHAVLLMLAFFDDTQIKA